MIWSFDLLGDYWSYEETIILLEDNNWDTSLEKDQVCPTIHILSTLVQYHFILSHIHSYIKEKKEC